MGKHSGGKADSIVPRPIHKGVHAAGKVVKLIAKARKGKKDK